MVLGQYTLIPIGPSHATQSDSGKKKSGARIQSETPLTLPFWDDFSFTSEDEKEVPLDSFWITRKSVWVNNGIGINPPSIYSATFDGIDSTGKPYNITDVEAKGFADRLVSRAIDLSTLPASQNDSVYLSFFYQVTGLGEAPDPDDNLSLWFKDVNGTWEKVFEAGNDGSLDFSEFYYKLVKVDPRFFHNNFQFRFQNFARLSGPYDTWNLDYVYLNKRRRADDIYFHDQSLTKPITSIFKQYRAIPMEHFKDTADWILTPPTAGFYNLFRFDAQSFKYSTFATIVDKQAGVENAQTIDIEIEGDPQTILPNFTHLDLPLAKTVPLANLNLAADSISIRFKLKFESGDNNPDPEDIFFEPIDFTVNDSTQSEFIIHNFYAHDDGTAEYGLGLNTSNTELAYGFDMLTTKPDTLVAVEIHFPEFGDNSSQNLTLRFWNANISGAPNSQLYQQSIVVQRKPNNQFTRYDLAEPVVVKNKFFVGWLQPTSKRIPVGHDRNTDSADKIFFNITGTWSQDVNLIGSLMIRPVFGKVDTVITSVRETLTSIYPNPSQGQFHIPLDARDVSMINLMGSSIPFESAKTLNSQLITLNNPQPGIYVIRFRIDNKLMTSKVLISN